MREYMHNKNKAKGIETAEQASDVTFYIQVKVTNIGKENIINDNAEMMTEEEIVHLLTTTMYSDQYKDAYHCHITLNENTGYVNFIDIQHT